VRTKPKQLVVFRISLFYETASPVEGKFKHMIPSRANLRSRFDCLRCVVTQQRSAE